MTMTSAYFSSSFPRKRESSAFAVDLRASASHRISACIQRDARSQSGASTRLRRAGHLQAKASTRLRRAGRFKAKASVPLRGPGYFSLLAQRKVTKRNAPQALRFSGFLPEKYATSACVPPIAHPCASGGIGAIHRAAPAGIAAAAAAMQWGPNSSALLRAEAKSERQKAKGKRQKAKSERRATVQADALLGRAGCASLLGPFALRRQRTIRPVRVGAGPRRFRWVHGRTFSGTRPLTRTFRAGARKAQCEGVLLFGYFLLHKQEKVTRSPQASGSLGA